MIECGEIEHGGREREHGGEGLWGRPVWLSPGCAFDHHCKWLQVPTCEINSPGAVNPGAVNPGAVNPGAVNMLRNGASGFLTYWFVVVCHQNLSFG